MKIGEIVQALGAEVLCGEDMMDVDIQAACGSDLMSDVLAFVEGHTVLLTGMTNPHVVRTCEMVDIPCVVFVRGKKPTEELLEMAREGGMCILCSAYTLYTSCGMLFRTGLRGHEARCK